MHLKPAAFMTVMLILLSTLPLAILIQLHNTRAAYAIDDLVNLSDNTGDSIDPALGVAGSVAYVAWRDNSLGSSTDYDIYFKKISDNGQTLSDTIVLDDGGANSFDPRLAISGDTIFVVWRTGSSGNTEIFYTTITDTGSDLVVSDSENLSNTLGSSFDPRIVVNSDGDAYVAWRDNSLLSNFDIYMQKISATTGLLLLNSTLVVSDNGGTSSTPFIAESGTGLQLVRPVFSGDWDILFNKITDNGLLLVADAAVDLSANSGTSLDPRIATSGTDTYIVWRDDSAGDFQLLLKKASGDGTVFGNSTSLTETTDGIPQDPSIDASGNGGSIYAAWRAVPVDGSSTKDEVYFRKVTDTGSSFSLGDILNLSNTTDGSSVEPQVVVSDTSSTVHVLWRDDYIDFPDNDAFLLASIDDGESFGCALNVSNTPAGNTVFPRIAVDEDQNGEIYLVMYDDVQGNNDVYLQTNFSASNITIESVSDDTPLWGIDSVDLGGRVENAGMNDIVSIDWKDGNVTEIGLSGCSWGPVSHTYDASSTSAQNPRNVTVTLLSSDGSVERASNNVTIDVRAHPTTLQLDQVSSALAGSIITVTGTITDFANNDEPLSGMNITFSGNGTDGLSFAISEDDGTFTATGSSSSTIATGWTVQAHFAGNSSHLSSDSSVVTYDTVSESSESYNVTAGENQQVDLTGLNHTASITFENVTSVGLVFVTECSSPDSGRYVVTSPIDTCLDISASATLAPGSSILLNVSFAGRIPDGYSSSDIDMFHESLGVITDVTQHRDSVDQSVAGNVTSLSKFIVGAAVHEAKPLGALRQQVYIGNENTVNFRDITDGSNSTATISLDKSSYRISDTATLTILDSNGNVDPNSVDIVSAGVISETSSPDGITLSLTETGANTATFKATFTFTRFSPSSGTILQANTGDEISVAYNIGARLQAVINEITESGLVQMSDSIVEQDADFRPIGGAVKLEPIDMQLGSIDTREINVTMSYANANLLGNAPNTIRILQQSSPGFWDDITLLDDFGNNIGVNETAKTVTGRTMSFGTFSLGVDIGSPGGAGGGLSRPGTGLVLDFVASIAATSSGGGGGGGGGGTSSSGSSSQESSSSSSVSSSTVESGTGTTATVTLAPVSSSDSESTSQGSTDGSGNGASEPSELTFAFENVESEGTIQVFVEPITQFTQLFTEITGGQGHISNLEQTTFTTAGIPYEIKPSASLVFDGFVDITIPYSEDLAMNTKENETQTAASYTAISNSEENMRFLLYDGVSWRDVTIGLNTTSNTVTGRLAALPTDKNTLVIAATAGDGTFGKSFIEQNPLKAMMVLGSDLALSQNGAGQSESSTSAGDGNVALEASPEDQITIFATFKNVQRINQTYSVFIQIIDEYGTSHGLSWQEGLLQRAEVAEISQNWSVPQEYRKEYTVQIFVWSDNENGPLPLSGVMTKTILVADT